MLVLTKFRHYGQNHLVEYMCGALREITKEGILDSSLLQMIDQGDQSLTFCKIRIFRRLHISASQVFVFVWGGPIPSPGGLPLVW